MSLDAHTCGWYGLLLFRVCGLVVTDSRNCTFLRQQSFDVIYILRLRYALPNRKLCQRTLIKSFCRLICCRARNIILFDSAYSVQAMAFVIGVQDPIAPLFGELRHWLALAFVLGRRRNLAFHKLMRIDVTDAICMVIVSA